MSLKDGYSRVRDFDPLAVDFQRREKCFGQM